MITRNYGICLHSNILMLVGNLLSDIAYVIVDPRIDLHEAK